MLRPISKKLSEGTLREDLERYKQKALELGATQAEIIPANWVIVDDRARLKCLIPPCWNYRQCYNCPPYTPETEFMRRALGKFSWALLFKHNIVPVEDFADRIKSVKGMTGHIRKTAQLCSELETLAFADGYYFAVAFSSGSCRDHLCDSGVCQALDSGRCKFPFISRPSMEAVSIDVFGLVTRVGWEIYPIHRGVNSKLVPCAITAGVVFIH